ncbi:MAG: thiamine phosphate synthase, partial [Thermoguttaceae bacterium]|nr:thiamine phosphate synthase [Thermoguttaceae bacterium]
PMSKETVKAICSAVSIPVVAIGGITRDNLLQLSGCGLSGAAVVSALFSQPDIELAAKELLARIETTL